MRVTVNGSGRDLPEGCTVAELVSSLADGTVGMAVAVNDEVVPRASWGASRLEEDDRVEVLRAIGGGA
jgi:sulfur carrier protein